MRIAVFLQARVRKAAIGVATEIADGNAEA